MANRRFNQFFQTPYGKSVLLSCNFVVDSANGNGLGIRSLKSGMNTISAVYMHTSASAAAGNPNPQSGVIIVQFADNYNAYLGGFSGQVSAIGSSQTTTTNHVAYVITVLGTATLAQWQAVGLPVGITPAVGAAFVANASGTIGGSAMVAPTATAGSGIDHIEVLGDTNQTIVSGAATVLGSGSGAYQILQCFSAGAVAAPADGCVIGLSFWLNNTSIQGAG